MALAELSMGELERRVTHPGVLSGKLRSPYHRGWDNPPPEFSEAISPVVAYISRSLRSDQAWTLEGVQFFTHGLEDEELGSLRLVYKTNQEPPIFKTGFLGRRRHLDLKEIFDSSITLKEDHHLRQGAVYKRSAEVTLRFLTDLLTPEQIQTGNITPGSLRWSYEVRVKPFILTDRETGYLAAEDPTRVRFNILLLDALRVNREAQESALNEWEQKRNELEGALELAKLKISITSRRNEQVSIELEKLPKPPLQLTP